MASRRESAATRLVGRRAHRKQVTRRDLLTAGRKLFGEEGLYESRIEDLSRHAGVAKGTLYGYFANKEALIEAVVTSGFSELLGHVHRRTQVSRTRQEALARMAEAHLAFFAENPDLMRIFHQVRGLLKFDRSGALRLRRVLTNYLAGLAHVLALHHPPQGQSDGDHLATAVLLFGAVSGISSTRASLLDSARAAVRSKATIRALVALASSFENPLGARYPAGARARARLAPAGRGHA